jgi:galactose oxidase-like protein
VTLQSKPPAEATDVLVGTVFEAVAGSNDPPPVSRTSPVGNPLTLPLKPKPLRPPALKTGRTGSVGLVPSLQPTTSERPSSNNKGGTATALISFSCVVYGETFSVGTPDASTIAKVTWIRLSSVTHSTNMNQRLNYLSFPPPAAGATALSVTAAGSANLAPPGHYMLFLVDQRGVPSVAKILQIH